MGVANRRLADSLLGMSVEEARMYRSRRLGSETMGMDTEFWGEMWDGVQWIVVPGFEFLPWDKGEYKSIDSLPIIKRFIKRKNITLIGNDGILAEIAPESNLCRQILLTNISLGIVATAWQLREYVTKVTENPNPVYGKDYRLSITPISREFDASWLETLPEKYQVLGCAPSLNAFGKEFRAAPEDSCDVITRRNLGTHIHLGASADKDYMARTTPLALALHEYPEVTVGLLELFVNVPLTWYWSNYSEELAARRETYGEAGCYRKTKYGLEWRGLPALAISSPWLYHAIYGMVRNVIHFAGSLLEHEGFDLLERIWDKADPERVRNIINNSDGDDARQLMQYFDRDFWKIHYCFGGNGIGHNQQNWKTFLFMADNPSVRRGKDFNVAWGMPLLMEAIEYIANVSGYDDTVTSNVGLSYSLFGGLSESLPAKDIIPVEKRNEQFVVDFMVNNKVTLPRAVYQHTCGAIVPEHGNRPLNIAFWKAEPQSDTDVVAKWSKRYCPRCNMATENGEWKKTFKAFTALAENKERMLI